MGRRGPLSKAVSNEAGEVTKAVAFPCPRGFFSEQAEPPSDSRERGKDPRVRRNHTHVGEGARSLCAPWGRGLGEVWPLVRASPVPAQRLASVPAAATPSRPSPGQMGQSLNRTTEEKSRIQSLHFFSLETMVNRLGKKQKGKVLD